MKIIVKKPKEDAVIEEVENMMELNKIIGNVDKNGDGLNDTGTDMRMGIGHDIDLYCNAHAAWNFEMKDNLWIGAGRTLLCGTIVFAGYDQTKKEDFGMCSLTDEQIDYCMMYIDSKKS